MPDKYFWDDWNAFEGKYLGPNSLFRDKSKEEMNDRLYGAARDKALLEERIQLVKASESAFQDFRRSR